jgi:Cupin-like domain
MSNILVQIVGDKEIITFNPSLIDELDFPPGASSSRIDDIFASDVRFKGRTTILRPGDALFIPPLWPHATKPLTPNISINVFWKSFKDEFYDRGKDVYGNRDLTVYLDGRKHIERIVKGFKDVDENTREFYLKRLAMELQELVSENGITRGI